MALDHVSRTRLLHARAAEYVDVALKSATQEYPHFPYFVATDADSYRLHREFHPAFYGSFDWHSCVEMHWVCVRLLRFFPNEIDAVRARLVLNELLTPGKLAIEYAFFQTPVQKSLERPYGWGWLLRLSAELDAWNDSDGKRWAEAVRPLAALLLENLIDWLPKLTYPQRAGMHPNTAFGISSALRFATTPVDRAALSTAALRLFLADKDYPAHYEPSGADFLSPALTEAELMSNVMEPPEFWLWLDCFLPGLADNRPEQLFTPAIVTDTTDGQIAHLHGLNLSRAWGFVRLANALPANDPRISLLLETAERHSDVSLPFVTGADYMVEHWLAAYATLLLSEGL